jgi:hypothetical protein
MATVSVDKFFSIFWSDEACRKIFLLHKEELLEKKEVDLSIKLVQRIENRELELGHELNSTTKRNIDQSKIDEYLNRTFAAPIQEFSKGINNNKIQQVRFIMEATSSLLSEKRFLKFLQKYKVIPAGIHSMDGLSKHFETFFKTEIGKFLTPQRITEFLASVDQISSYYQNAYIKDLMDANNFYSDILYQEENYKDRIAMFDLLYEAGVLQGGKFKGYYECTKCDYGIFNATVNIKTAPSKTKLKCPACGQETFYIVPYEIQEEIFEFIKHKDGLLFHLIKGLLGKKGLKFLQNVNLIADVEADLALLDELNRVNRVIEIKMFKSDRPEDTIRKNLEGGLRKFLDARKKLISVNPDWTGVAYHFITNITDESCYRELVEKFKNELSGTNVTVHSPDQFKNAFFADIYRNRS